MSGEATSFIIPGAQDRTIVMGATGTGKTTFGAYLLCKQRLDKRPWVIIDFKNEELWDGIPMRRLKLTELPHRPGLYRLKVLPGQDDALEAWLWKIWRKEDTGIFCDEASLMPTGSAFKAILRQGRSKRIPVIACTQRPVDVDRELFTESRFKSVFRLDDERDYKIIKGFTRGAPIDEPLPKYYSYWHDSAQSKTFVLQPAPNAVKLRDDLGQHTPVRTLLA